MSVGVVGRELLERMAIASATVVWRPGRRRRRSMPPDGVDAAPAATWANRFIRAEMTSRSAPQGGPTGLEPPAQ
jgi:hypothetical protein